MRVRRGHTRTKVLLGGALLALCLTPVASAKFMLWLTIGDSTPRVGQSITVVLHAERDLPNRWRAFVKFPRSGRWES